MWAGVGRETAALFMQRLWAGWKMETGRSRQRDPGQEEVGCKGTMGRLLYPLGRSLSPSSALLL